MNIQYLIFNIAMFDGLPVFETCNSHKHFLKVFKLTMYLFSWDSFDRKKMVSIYFLFFVVVDTIFFFRLFSRGVWHLGSPWNSLITSYNPILRLNAIHLLNIHEELECLHHDKRRGRRADYINVFQFPLLY